jgi:hypothetical protein
MWSYYPSPSDLDLTCSSERGENEGQRISASYAIRPSYGAKFSSYWI